MLIIGLLGRGEERGSAMSLEAGAAASCSVPSEGSGNLETSISPAYERQVTSLASLAFFSFLTSYIKILLSIQNSKHVATPVIINLTVCGNSDNSTHFKNPYNFILPFYCFASFLAFVLASCKTTLTKLYSKSN